MLNKRITESKKPKIVKEQIENEEEIIETKEAINKNYCKDIEFVTDL